MTVITKEIFNQYFKRKLILWICVGVIATLIRSAGGHRTSFRFVLAVLSFFALVALIIGYIDYHFYRNSASKIISRLLDEEPLLCFQKIDFVKEDANKLQGQINNYKIILSPLTNLESDKVLTILIPLQIKEGLDDYFTKYNDYFRFTLSGEIVFAEAIIKNYKNAYTYKKLFDLIDRTTKSLREQKIEPLTTLDD